MSGKHGNISFSEHHTPPVYISGHSRTTDLEEGVGHSNDEEGWCYALNAGREMDRLKT